MNTLTGRRQYRATKHGLILQVEWCYWDADKDMFGGWRCIWEDAAQRDVMAWELAVA